VSNFTDWIIEVSAYNFSPTAFRLGLMVAKTALVKLLLEFNFRAVCNEELDFDFASIGLVPKPGTCKVRIDRKPKLLPSRAA
jgi:hypothetical protein